MRQALRILFIYLIIIGLAYAMLFFIPIKFIPQSLNFSTPELITNQQDSSEIISLLRQDSLLLELKDSLVEVPVKKDTIIVADYLSCPTKFLSQLKTFHEKLNNAHENKEVVRILHFGDSQIEGDRITEHLRESFQARFGGSGPGLNCILDPQRMNPSVWLDNNDSWQLESIYDRNRDKSRNTYGLLGQYALIDTTLVGEFKISKSPWAEPHAKNYQRIKLFLAPHSDSVFIKGSIKNTEVINDSLQSSSNLTEINWLFSQVSPSILFQLKSKKEVAVLGVALDNISGVAVDNIALRGQSSPLLHRTNADLFKAMGEQLNIGMIILQYGTNIIPTETSNYGFYRKILAKQFNLLTEYLPDVPVLFVGVADAAKSIDGQTESYEHLIDLRNTQKELALKYDFAYFDLYEAMGGAGSIVKWTEKEPPLALTDYVHFSRKGGEKAAEYLIKALWNQFDELYQKNDSNFVSPDSLQLWKN